MTANVLSKLASTKNKRLYKSLLRQTLTSPTTDCANACM